MSEEEKAKPSILVSLIRVGVLLGGMAVLAYVFVIRPNMIEMQFKFAANLMLNLFRGSLTFQLLEINATTAPKEVPTKQSRGMKYLKWFLTRFSDRN